MSPQDNHEYKLNHAPSQSELIEFYNLSQKNNPDSLLYERPIIRPKIHIFRALLYTLLTIFIAALSGVAVWFCCKSTPWVIVTSLGIVLLAFFIFLKHIIIWFVKVYQRFAPEDVRKRCRFEPSCSHYMIAAIEKYGLIKGLKKGRYRWKRCKPPNGGYDEP